MEKTTPTLPALKYEPTDDTAALTCYALDWRQCALDAERQRDGLLAALENLLHAKSCDAWDIRSAISDAHAAIATARREV